MSGYLFESVRVDERERRRERFQLESLECGERVAVSALVQSRWQPDGSEQGARALGCFYGTVLPMFQYAAWARRAEYRAGESS